MLLQRIIQNHQIFIIGEVVLLFYLRVCIATIFASAAKAKPLGGGELQGIVIVVKVNQSFSVAANVNRRKELKIVIFKCRS